VTEPDRPGRQPPEEPEPIGVMGFFGRPRTSRREKIRREIERGRQSRIPTWVLVVTLVAFVAAWALLIAYG
jgi:hypothetical protein